MGAHALLSASSSKRWLNCPPSARLEENFPNESSAYAEEGTWAHELCEYKVKRYLHRRMKRPQSEYLTEEIENLTDIYAEFVIGVIEKLKAQGHSVLALVEERLDYSHIAPSGFGTGDMVILAPGILHICDFKTVSGVYVDADHNTQMMLYALGALHAYDYLFDVQTVSMTIIQPRLENISTFTTTKQELLDWAEGIKPVAKLAFEGKGEQKPGDWCRFCRAKPMCRARAEEALALAKEEFLDLEAGALAEKTELTDATAPYSPDTKAPTFKSPALISQAEIETILPTLNRISDWITAVFAYVSNEAINHGTHWAGYKVVEGRSKRQFTDTKAVIDAAAKEGFTDVYKQELLSLTEFEKMMGKKRFAQILGKYVVKPPGKLALVPESDPRPAVDLNSSAGDEFEPLDG